MKPNKKKKRIKKKRKRNFLKFYTALVHLCTHRQDSGAGKRWKTRKGGLDIKQKPT